MIASFILSRTLTPTMANWLLRGQLAARHAAKHGKPGPFTRLQRGFDTQFERFRTGYRNLLDTLAARRRLFVSGYLLASLASLLLLIFVGQDFFPSIKSSEMEVNVGDFIGANGVDVTQQSTPQPLFTVDDVHEVRIFVSVPQTFGDVLKPGPKAELYLPGNSAKALSSSLAERGRGTMRGMVEGALCHGRCRAPPPSAAPPPPP